MDQAIMDLQELVYCHAERKLQEEIYCRENIVNCIGAINKKWHKNAGPILASIQVKNTKRNAKSDQEAFFAKSIHASRNWTDCDLDRCSLDNIPEKADWLIYRLTHKKSGKDYNLIDDTTDKNWFYIIATISATIRTLTWRHEEKKFVDPEAEQRIGRLITLQQEKEMIAQGAGHAKKHEEDAQTALTPIIEAFQNRITDTFFPPYTRELPPLPQGVALPIDPIIRLITAEK